MREIAGQAILVPIRHAGADLHRVFTLNETAAEVWRLLAKPHTLQQLVDALSREYDGHTDDIRADVEALLEQMSEKDCIIAEQADG